MCRSRSFVGWRRRSARVNKKRIDCFSVVNNWYCRYTLIKLRVLEPLPAPLASLAGRPVFLVYWTLKWSSHVNSNNRRWNVRLLLRCDQRRCTAKQTATFCQLAIMVLLRYETFFFSIYIWWLLPKNRSLLRQKAKFLWWAIEQHSISHIKLQKKKNKKQIHSETKIQ